MWWWRWWWLVHGGESGSATTGIAATSMRAISIEVTSLVRPETSNCNTNNVFSIEVTNGRCNAITLDSLTATIEAPPNGCGDQTPFTVDLDDAVVESQQTVTLDYATISWCCNGCRGSFTCAWKVDVDLSTSAGNKNAVSEFFRKTFKSSCRTCTSAPESPGQGPEVACESSVGVVAPP